MVRTVLKLAIQTNTDIRQTKDFVKFLSLVFILYMGFLTTFILLARGVFTPREMVRGAPRPHSQSTLTFGVSRLGFLSKYSLGK